MKVLLGLALLCLAESFHDERKELWRGMEGRDIVYDYKDFVYSGFPVMDDQYSVLKIEAKLHVYPESQNRLVLQMKQIQLGKASRVDIPNLSEEDIPVTTFRSKEYEEMLSKPFRFSTEQGKVESYEMDRSEKIWSMNIKRAIIEKFQVRLSYVSHEIPTDGGVIPTPSYVHTFKLEEDGIGGVCNNYYVLQSEKDFFYPHTSSHVLNVTKTRDFRDCKYRPAFEHSNFDHLGCPSACKSQMNMPPHRTGHYRQEGRSSCPCGLESYKTPIQSYAVTKYNISLYRNAIDSIINEGKTSLYVKGNVIVVYTRTNLTLLEIRSGRAPSVQSPVHYRELSYVPDPEIYASYPSLSSSQHQQFFVSPVKPQDHRDAINVCLKLLQRIAENIMRGTVESGRTVSEDVLKVVKTMSTLDAPSLEELREKIVGTSRGARLPEKKIIMRQVFLDCLPLCGTNDAAQYIMTLPKMQVVEEYEAKSMIEAIPKNLVFPSIETIQKLKDLCLSDREIRRNVTLFSSTCVAFGKLVNVACVEPYRQSSEEHEVLNKFLPEHMKIELCTDEHVKQFTREVEERLVNAREYCEKTTYIEVIAHFAHKSGLRVLEPYVSGRAGNCRQDDEEPQTVDAVCNMLRTITVYSLHHLVEFYPTEVRDLVLPIYFSVNEPYELRTACFSVMIYSDPPLPILERVATESWTETNNHVGSFVYSALNELANKTHPCDKSVVEKARTVVPKMKQFELGYLYSKFLIHDFYDEQTLFGMESFLSYTSSNVSMFPRSVYFALFHNWATYFNMPLEIGANVKGMEDLLSKIDFSELLTPKEKSWEQKDEKISYKERKPENFKATVFLKWFERTSYYSLDRKTAVDALQRFVNALKHTSAEPYHYIKVLMPNSVFKLVPSEIGLPVVVASMNPIVLSFKLDKFNIATNTNSGTKKNIETTITPAVYVTSVLTSTLVSPPDQMCYGSSVIRTDNFAIPIKLTATTVYNSVNPSLKLTVNPVTALPYEALHHKTIAGTFVHNCWLIHPDSSIYEGLKPIQSLPKLSEINVTLSSKILGRGLSFQGVTDDVWGRIPFWNQPIAKRLGIFPALLEVAGNPEWVYRDFRLLVIQDPNSPVSSNQYDFYLDYKRERMQGSSSGKSQPWFGHESSSFSSESIESTENNNLDGIMENIYGRRSQPPKSQLSPQWMIIPDGTKSIFPGGFRHIITGSIQSDRSPYLPLQMVLKYYPNFNYRDHSIDLSVSLKSIDRDSRQWKLVASSLIKYPKIPSDFQYASPARGDQATWNAQVSWGKSGNSRQSEIKIQGILNEIGGLSTDVQGWGRQSRGSSWYEEQCKRDTSEGKTRSYACKVAIEQNNVFRKFSADVHYSQISPKIMNFTRTLDLMAKAHFYANMDRNILPAVSHISADKLRVELEFPLFNPDLTIVDVSLFKQSEDVLYKLLYLPFVLPASSVLKYYEAYENYLLSYRYLTECSIMENYMTTFDNVTIPFPKDNCEYVISRDCSHCQLYTVYAKQVRENKVITIEAAEHRIIILSVNSPRSAQISVDGTVRQLNTDTPIYITTKKDYISIYLLDTPNNLPSTVVVEIPEVGILVKSDCKRALVKVNPYYWGRHCGACGDFNGEGYLDYLGPDQCIYKLSEDNVYKYAVKDAGCQVPPQGPSVCPASNRPFPGSTRESNSCKLLHTLYIKRGNQVCFGHDPVIKCMGSCRPTKNVKTTMRFHCVDKDDYFTQQLMHIADIMVLPNMASLPPALLTQTFATISDCTPDHM